jgi:cytochrome c oxidase assembly factor 2
MTSSLFATTVLASFFVVALPHILPCPAPRRRAYYADDGEMQPQHSSLPGQEEEGAASVDGTRRPVRVRRVRRRDVDGDGNSVGDGEGNGVVEFQAGRSGTGGEENGNGRRVRAQQRRECPVPKPGGILGEWLGFHSGGDGRKEGGDKTRPER